jgi:hypothetical protein
MSGAGTLRALLPEAHLSAIARGLIQVGFTPFNCS